MSANEDQVNVVEETNVVEEGGDMDVEEPQQNEEQMEETGIEATQAEHEDGPETTEEVEQEVVEQVNENYEEEKNGLETTEEEEEQVEQVKAEETEMKEGPEMTEEEQEEAGEEEQVNVKDVDETNDPETTNQEHQQEESTEEAHQVDQQDDVNVDDEQSLKVENEEESKPNEKSPEIDEESRPDQPGEDSSKLEKQLSFGRLSLALKSNVANEAIENLRLLLSEAQDEQIQLSGVNEQLQNQVSQLWEKYGVPSIVSSDLSKLKESQSYYFDKLNSVWELYNTFRKKQESYAARIDRLNGRLDEEDENAGELKDSLREFKREICKAAVFTRTGKSIPNRKIYHMEQEEEKLDKEIEVLRLKNIHFRNQVNRLTTQLQEKEQLSEGLHLIDFEQLKIENQTLNEKIEERNDELHKLRKKITTTVQILTHIKEKLKHVEYTKQELAHQLEEIETNGQTLRDELGKAKKQRENLRKYSLKLKQKQGFVGSNLLMIDYEKRKNDLVHLRQHIDQLQNQHADLTSYLRKAAALSQS